MLRSHRRLDQRQAAAAATAAAATAAAATEAAHAEAAHADVAEVLPTPAPAHPPAQPAALSALRSSAIAAGSPAPVLVLPEPAEAEMEEARQLAERSGAEVVDLNRLGVDRLAAATLPPDVACCHRAVVVGHRFRLPLVAIATPEDGEALRSVAASVGGDALFVVAPGSQIDACLTALYAPAGEDCPPLAPGSDESIDRAEATSQEMPTAVPCEGLYGLEDVDWYRIGCTLQRAPGAVPETPTGPQQAPEPAPELDQEPADELEPEAPLEPEPEPEAEAEAQLEAEAEAQLEPEAVPVGEPSPTPVAEPPYLTPGPDGHGWRSGRLDRDIDARVSAAAAAYLRELPGIAKPMTPSVEPVLDAAEWEAGAIPPPDPVAASDPAEGTALDAHPEDADPLGGDRTTVEADPDEEAAVIADLEPVVVTALGSFETSATTAPGDAADLPGAGGTDDIEPAARPFGFEVEEATERLIELVLARALDDRTTEVHLDPGIDEVVVRRRIDGVLHRLTSTPAALREEVTARLKLLAGLDAGERDLPQVGSFSLGAGRRETDVELVTLPTAHGEKLVLRLPDRELAPLQLGDLGFLPEVLERYRSAVLRRSGAVIVVGPDRSGRRTALYSTLAELNVPERNLVLVTEHGGVDLAGVANVRLRPSAGFGIAEGVRAALACDPDVVAVGELRDRATALHFLEAALGDRLLLGRLQGDGAASAPQRLLELGAEPYLVASALDAVLAQRFVRRLCRRCAQPYQPHPSQLEAVGWHDDLLADCDTAGFLRPSGCETCLGTGYRGHLGLQEVMVVGEDMKRAIAAGASSLEISRLASTEGMRSMAEDGLRKAALGITSLEEAYKATL